MQFRSFCHDKNTHAYLIKMSLKFLKIKVRMNEYYFPSPYHNGLYAGSCDMTPDSWTRLVSVTSTFMDMKWRLMAPEPQNPSRENMVSVQLITSS